MNSNKSKLAVTFVLPTFNERNNILFLLKELLKLDYKYKLEIIVVDDNSKDGTSEAVRRISKEDNKIKLIKRLDRFGLSSAIKEGCINTTNEIIAIIDRDGQHLVQDVVNSIEKLSSLTIIANIGLATSFYNYVFSNILFSQLAGIIIVLIWNYAESSRVVWEI